MRPLRVARETRISVVNLPVKALILVGPFVAILGRLILNIVGQYLHHPKSGVPIAQNGGVTPGLGRLTLLQTVSSDSRACVSPRLLT